MTWAHVHLALNHVPVIGIVFIILLFGTAVVRENTDLARVSYGLIVVVAVIALGVYFTGEPAEELVERLPGFSERLVDRHEDAALVATVGMSLLGLAAIGGLVRRQPQLVLEGRTRPKSHRLGSDGMDGKPRRPDTAY